MILAIDIGNTTTNFGVFEGGRLGSQFSIATKAGRTPDEVTRQLKTLERNRRLGLARAQQIILCSVVPRMTSVLVRSLRSLVNTKGRGGILLRVVGRDLKVPLKNRYTYPRQVGQDRLVGAYAAWIQFGRGQGAASPPLAGGPANSGRGGGRGNDCIVCDFGTAITIDVVTKGGAYLGGIIAPGLGISLDALATRTALLPKVELKEPPELLGRDTANSIRSGILYGCVALCDGLVGQLKRRYAPKAVVVATGGASPLIARHARTIDHLKPHLVLEGLYRLSIRK